MTTHTILSSLL